MKVNQSGEDKRFLKQLFGFTFKKKLLTLQFNANCLWYICPEGCCREKQEPFHSLLPDFYYYCALTANTASKLAISVTMAIKWVRFLSIMTRIVRTSQTARAFAQGRKKMHFGENSYFNSLWGLGLPYLSVHSYMENYHHHLMPVGADARQP